MSDAPLWCLCRSVPCSARACAPWRARCCACKSSAQRRPSCSVHAKPATVCKRHSPAVVARAMARSESLLAVFVTGPYITLRTKFVEAGPDDATYKGYVASLPFLRCPLCVLPCPHEAQPRMDSRVTGSNVIPLRDFSKAYRDGTITLCGSCADTKNGGCNEHLVRIPYSGT